MAKYALTYSAFATTTALKTSGGIFPNAAGENVEVIESIMTGGGTVAAADIQHQHSLSFCTFAATGVSVSTTPLSFHTSAVAGLATTGVKYTTEPTAYAAIPHVLFGFNQRGGMRWAVPQGEGMRAQNDTTNKGVGQLVISSAVGTVDGSLHYWES